MKFKELRTHIDESYIILDTKEGRFEEFNTRSEKYDDCEVCTIQHCIGGIFVAID